MAAFTVVQFNMQYGQVWDPADPDNAPVRLEATIELLRAQSPDVILLQEVEHAGDRGRQPEPPVNFPKLMGALPGYHGYFQYPPADEKELPFGIGLAILSRSPLEERMARPLPAADIEFEFRGKTYQPTERLVIGAVTEFGGQKVRVLNTHLQAYFMIDATSDDHPEQRQLVAGLLRESREPTLIGGDFNVTPTEGLLAEFERAGYRPVQTRQTTWKRRPYVTDHILHNGGLRCMAVAVVPTDASDHDLLRAEFEVRR